MRGRVDVRQATIGSLVDHLPAGNEDGPEGRIAALARRRGQANRLAQKCFVGCQGVRWEG